MAYAYQTLLQNIHNEERHIVKSRYFTMDCRIANLEFVNASEYIITDFGAIWERTKFWQDAHGYVSKGFLPLVKRDSMFPYPWVYLHTISGHQWFPVNLLLGWAFQPYKDITPRSFELPSHLQGLQPCRVNMYEWHDIDLQQVTSLRSCYLEFLNDLYHID